MQQCLKHNYYLFYNQVLLSNFFYTCMLPSSTQSQSKWDLIWSQLQKPLSTVLVYLPIFFISLVLSFYLSLCIFQFGFIYFFISHYVFFTLYICRLCRRDYILAYLYNRDVLPFQSGTKSHVTRNIERNYKQFLHRSRTWKWDVWNSLQGKHACICSQLQLASCYKVLCSANKMFTAKPFQLSFNSIGIQLVLFLNNWNNPE